MEVKGFFKKDLGVNNVSDKFTKRDFVLHINGNKPEYYELVVFTLFNATVDVINDLKDGDEVTVHFNLRGKEYKKKDGSISYFNTLNAYKVVKEVSNGDNPYLKANNSFKVDEDDLLF